MKNIILLVLVTLFGVKKGISQAQHVLSGDQPLVFTSLGNNSYNKSVVYHNQTNGFYIDLARISDNVNAKPIDFKINARGGVNHFLTIKGETGNVGIGTSSPEYKLDVASTVKVGDGDWGALIIDGKEKNDWLFNAHNGGSTFGIRTQRDNGEANWSYQVLTIQRATGNIGIGTITPDMKLTVKGNIHAEEVKIDLSVPAPDYVFKKDYNLKSIEEVEKYILKNSHLPEIPSAKEFEENGMMLAEMDMNLLKKIEELTLYTIQQEKEIKKQKNAIKILNKNNVELKSMNKKLLELQSRLEKLESEK